MEKAVYEVRFTLDDGLKKTASLSSKVATNDATSNKQTQEKILKQQEKERKDRLKNISVGATTTLAVAAKGYQTYLQLRNIMNSHKMVNASISGDILSAKNYQLKTARNDAIVGKISTVLNPALSGAAGGFAVGPKGAAVGFVAGLGVGIFNLVTESYVENMQIQTQERAYFANQQVQNYINTIERERLIKAVGFYR